MIVEPTSTEQSVFHLSKIAKILNLPLSDHLVSHDDMGVLLDCFFPDTIKLLEIGSFCQTIPCILDNRLLLDTAAAVDKSNDGRMITVINDIEVQLYEVFIMLPGVNHSL